MNTPRVLDTTLRDGSYAIDFRFTAKDVEIICHELEEAGVELIEIGHGVGLGANRSQEEKAICSDEEYLRAAERTVKKAEFGMFCIPGIGTTEDIKMAASHGMGFVRIGSNVEDVPRTKDLILEAKRQGLFVCANYMKSYAVSPEEFADKAVQSEDYGADCVYIVDSAGGMLPSQISAYYAAVREKCEIEIGFHGHDNLGMAVANSLYCAGLGVSLIDASICGLGRSSGNARMEVLLPVLKKAGYDNGIDWYRILGLARKQIEPLSVERYINPLDIVCGIAGFHSSYMKYIYKCVTKYEVNPLKLIIEWCNYDQTGMDYDGLCRIAAKMPKEPINLHEFHFEKYIGDEQTLSGGKGK